MFNLVPIDDVLFEIDDIDAFKTHARIFNTTDDDYLAMLLVAARKQVEKDLEKAVVGQEYNLHLEHWLDWRYIDRYFSGIYSRNPFYFQGPHIVLPITPVQSVASITYTDPNGDPQTMDPSLYRLRAHKDPVDILLLGSIPAIKAQTDIVIDFVAGYASYDAIPMNEKIAAWQLAAHWNEHRLAASDLNTAEVPIGYERIINRCRVKRMR